MEVEVHTTKQNKRFTVERFTRIATARGPVEEAACEAASSATGAHPQIAPHTPARASR